MNFINVNIIARKHKKYGSNVYYGNKLHMLPIYFLKKALPNIIKQEGKDLWHI